MKKNAIILGVIALLAILAIFTANQYFDITGQINEDDKISCKNIILCESMEKCAYVCDGYSDCSVEYHSQNYIACINGQEIDYEFDENYRADSQGTSENVQTGVGTE
ncbi:MAG: hypothetical protein U9R08_03590 [Nanoarchaeota archaeon]|nr:hypothetical protein [Nanoarchaeota archaeon]